MRITGVLFFLCCMAIIPIVARAVRHRNKNIARRSRETWAIGRYEGPSPLTLAPPPGISNPVLTANEVTDVKARFVADPFMLQNATGYHLFFEVLNDKRNTGEIGYAYSTDGSRWQYRNIVLRERYHLSYPYIFYWNGHYYMIPECMGSGGIQLYRATRFPETWQRVATLVRRTRQMRAIVDPSIIHYRNHWYLFSYAMKQKSLHLFTAPEPAGPWKEHPKSPVLSGSPHFARPGGRVIQHEGVIYRYAQDEVPLYGSRVWAFRITELSETGYSEETVPGGPVIQAGSEWWNSAGMHTVDPHQKDSGEWFAFVDGFSIQHPS